MKQRYQTCLRLEQQKWQTEYFCISIRYAPEEIGTKHLQIVIIKAMKVMKRIWIQMIRTCTSDALIG